MAFHSAMLTVLLACVIKDDLEPQQSREDACYHLGGPANVMDEEWNQRKAWRGALMCPERSVSSPMPSPASSREGSSRGREVTQH